MELDFSNTKPVTGFVPTDEQQAIIDAFVAGDDMVVEAGAGSGKTSTLKLLAKAKPNKFGMYFAYNRAIADDAKASFPRNVRCGTAHSFAIRTLTNEHRYRLNSPRQSARVVANVLGIFDPVVIETSDGIKDLPPAQVARIVMETVSHFCHSAESDVRSWHVPSVINIEGDAVDQLEAVVLPLARAAWSDLQEPVGRLKFDHDHYLKMWQLSDPDLNCDFVFLDEAQDANPVIASIIEQQTCQRIMVGDANQAIYGWRGATNAMRKFKGTRKLLTQSFRFGNAVADEANKWLTVLGSDLRIRGYNAIASRIDYVENPDAILCRTNAGAMAEVIGAHARGQRVAVVGGGDQIRRLAMAARDLKAGIKTDHPELFLFESWEELNDYVKEDAGGSDLKVMVNLINEHTPEAIIRTVDKLVDEVAADITVSTAHKAKGREWNSVRIASDFRQPKDNKPIEDSEAMLAYVAVTRAKQVLDNTGLAWVDSYL